jgi:hypothetical protein
MALTQGFGAARILDDGQTSVQSANQFVTVSTAGARDLVSRFLELATAASAPSVLRKAVRKASDPLMKDYGARAKSHEATGNLSASVTRKYVDYPEGVVVVVGPRQTGPVGSTSDRRSGNHAWLVEFGTDARKPGSRGRRVYVNVHQSINRRMRKSGSFNNTQFEQMGRGYYFLMGSINEPSRRTGKPGYSRDFAGPGPGGDGRKQHPITLAPGETIAPMKPLGLMEKSISATGASVLAVLRSTLEAEINARGG